jgi:hypothetical protein
MLLVVLVFKISVQGILVKARFAIEKVTLSPGWHLNAPFSSVTLECVAVALKQANGALLEEIRKLSGLKRTDADNATVEDFEQQQQTLTMAVNALMVSYAGQKNAADKATMLTGYWKAPVIKGLDYAWRLLHLLV